MSTTNTQLSSGNYGNFNFSMSELMLEYEKYRRERRNTTHDIAMQQEQTSCALMDKSLVEAEKEIEKTQSAAKWAAIYGIGGAVVGGIGGVVKIGGVLKGADKCRHAARCVAAGDAMIPIGQLGTPIGQLSTMGITADASRARVEADRCKSLMSTHDRESGTTETRSHDSSAEGLSFYKQMNDLYAQSLRA